MRLAFFSIKRLNVGLKASLLLHEGIVNYKGDLHHAEAGVRVHLTTASLWGACGPSRVIPDSFKFLCSDNKLTR